MKFPVKYLSTCISLSILFLLPAPGIFAQDLHLVWSEEFDGNTINTEIWQFESGPTNDNIHYYTNRIANANISDGKLQIIALKESYQGYEYTSAHIRTENSWSSRYGRIEASIKLPGTKGFVPAFWMLPVDSRYGWWPYSGEIDIMEYPSTELNKIYGTVHTENYNLFKGPLPPQGGTIDIPDINSNFHLFAIEWSPEKIDFFADDQKYYTFVNDNVSSASWPFDQPFYIILNLAVGGGWVGAPDESTVFPAIMEVDYIRVYQEPQDLIITGPDFVTYNSENLAYRVGEIEGASYLWTVPGGAQITAGQGTSEIRVDWGIFGGDVEVLVTASQGSYLKEFPVRVDYNLLKNSSFEKGIKYWNSRIGYPVVAELLINNDEAYDGTQSVFSFVEQPPTNPWDVQLSQGDITLQAGTWYHASLLTKSGLTSNQITAAVINSSNFALAAQKAFIPGENWEMTEFTFNPSQSFTALFNVDMGANTGSYYLDDFVLTTPELMEMNLVKNPDFFDGKDDWVLTTLSGAVAERSVIDGEYFVSISNAGINPWDVHTGQTGLQLEQGYEYTFSFDVYAGAPREITPIVGKNSEPWTVYSDGEPVLVTTNRQTYSITFPMTEATDLDSRLGFDIGGEGGEVYFDNILLRKGREINTSTSLSNNEYDSSLLIRNYPSPVSTYTSFYYSLKKPARVSLRIYNLKGQQVETIENGFRQEGDYRINWKKSELPAGVYFYRFEVDKKSVMKKFVLIE